MNNETGEVAHVKNGLKEIIANISERNTNPQLLLSHTHSSGAEERFQHLRLNVSMSRRICRVCEHWTLLAATVQRLLGLFELT